MNMNNPLENLRQLTEAVRMAGADIAPTYIEYVQLHRKRLRGSGTQ